MKVIFLLTFWFSLNSQAFFYKEEDKNLHVTVAFASTLLGTEALLLTTDLKPKQALFITAATVLVLGFAKETLLDDKIDNGDLLANTIGVGLASVPFLIIEF